MFFPDVLVVPGLDGRTEGVTDGTCCEGPADAVRQFPGHVASL